MSDIWIARWQVNSMSNLTATYTVGLKNDGTWGCSCPRWKFHKAPKVDCKHIERIKAVEPMDESRPSVALKQPPKQLIPVRLTKQPKAVEPMPSGTPFFVIQTRRVITLED